MTNDLCFEARVRTWAAPARLSLRAFAIYVWLCSEDPAARGLDKRFTVADLWHHFGEGRDACATAIKELIGAGLAKREPIPAKNGQLATKTSIIRIQAAKQPETIDRRSGGKLESIARRADFQTPAPLAQVPIPSAPTERILSTSGERIPSVQVLSTCTRTGDICTCTTEVLSGAEETPEAGRSTKTFSAHESGAPAHRAAADDIDESSSRRRPHVGEGPACPPALDDEDDSDAVEGETPRPLNQAAHQGGTKGPHDDADEQDDHLPPSTRGWAAATALASTVGGRARPYTFRQGTNLLVFLENEPFAAFRQHFVTEKAEGRKNYTCISRSRGGCPICDDLGYQVDRKFAFNVVSLDAGDNVDLVVEVLYAGPRLLGIIEDAHNDATSPDLSNAVWQIKRIGEGTKTTYSMNAVTSDDLIDEFNVSKADLSQALQDAHLELYGEDILETPTWDELMDIVDELGSSARSTQRS